MTARESLNRKIDLLARGVRIGGEAPAAPAWLAPGAAVDLLLEGGPLVRVRLREASAGEAYGLRQGVDERWEVSDGEWRVGAELLTRRGPGALGRVRGRFLVIPADAAASALPTPGEVVDEIRGVFAAGRADFVRLAWDPGRVALSSLLGLVREIRNQFDTFLQVTAGPMSADLPVDLYAGGVDALGLEAWPDEPGLRELLARAGAVFPAGTTSWHVPWSPSWAAQAPELFARALACQVVPVVDLAPLCGRALAPGEAEAVVGVLDALHRAVREGTPGLLWVQEEGDELGPLEAAALAGEGLGFTGLVRELADTRVGSAAARGLAHLRRALRVKRVRQSFESAGL